MITLGEWQSYPWMNEREAGPMCGGRGTRRGNRLVIITDVGRQLGLLADCSLDIGTEFDRSFGHK